MAATMNTAAAPESERCRVQLLAKHSARNGPEVTTLPDGQQMLMEPVTGQFPQVTPGTVQPGPLTQPPGPGYMYAAPPGTEAAPGPGFMYAVPTATEPVPTELPADAAPGPGYVFAAPEGVPPGAMYAAPATTEVPPGAMYAAPAATEVPPGAMYAAPEMPQGAMYAAPAAMEGAMYAAPAASEGVPPGAMYAAPIGEGSEGQPAPAPMLGQTIMGNTYQVKIPVDSVRDESGAAMTPLAWVGKLSSQRQAS
ncbi:unnamed protein product [Symbiodinium sp. KB8]|nr:unnamed protein product [Symbiodinium sp. KB8]